MKVFKTNTLIRKTIIYDVYFYKEPPFVLMNSRCMGQLNLIIHHYCLKGFVYCQEILHSDNYVGFSI